MITIDYSIYLTCIMGRSKSILITGSNSGIGFSAAEQLAGKGTVHPFRSITLPSCRRVHPHGVSGRRPCSRCSGQDPIRPPRRGVSMRQQ